MRDRETLGKGTRAKIALRMRKAMVETEPIAFRRRLVAAGLHREAEEAAQAERGVGRAEDRLKIRDIDEDVGGEHEIRPGARPRPQERLKLSLGKLVVDELGASLGQHA